MPSLKFKFKNLDKRRLKLKINQKRNIVTQEVTALLEYQPQLSIKLTVSNPKMLDSILRVNLLINVRKRTCQSLFAQEIAKIH